MNYSPNNYVIQWDHPKLDILVEFSVVDGFIEVSHVYGYTYREEPDKGKHCIARLFNQDELIDDYQSSAEYDMERRTA